MNSTPAPVNLIEVLTPSGSLFALETTLAGIHYTFTKVGLVVSGCTSYNWQSLSDQMNLDITHSFILAELSIHLIQLEHMYRTCLHVSENILKLKNSFKKPFQFLQLALAGCAPSNWQSLCGRPSRSQHPFIHFVRLDK